MPRSSLKSLIGCFTGKKGANESDGENLPNELIIESILTRLPARTLAVCCCVSKLRYNSILNDSRFLVIHSNQNKSKVSLVFNLLNVRRSDSMWVCFFSLLGREKANIRVELLSGFHCRNKRELVGFCNGLACTKLVSYPGATYGFGFGFGFDPLSQGYKTVIVFVSEANTKFLCMVVTLGIRSWRKIIASTFDILPPPLHSSLYPSRMVTRVSKTLCRAATFCGGDLFWRTQNQVGSNSNIEMLLSFDLHKEKIHFIQLPNECTLATVANELRHLVVDHLLAFKGYPCIARSERITRSDNDHHCNHLSGVCCCCYYKVHMYNVEGQGQASMDQGGNFRYSDYGPGRFTTNSPPLLL